MSSTAWVTVAGFAVLALCGFGWWLMNTFMGAFIQLGENMGTTDIGGLSLFWIWIPVVALIAVVVYAISSSTNKPDSGD